MDRKVREETLSTETRSQPIETSWPDFKTTDFESIQTVKILILWYAAINWQYSCTQLKEVKESVIGFDCCWENLRFRIAEIVSIKWKATRKLRKHCSYQMYAHFSDDFISLRRLPRALSQFCAQADRQFFLLFCHTEHNPITWPTAAHQA